MSKMRSARANKRDDNESEIIEAIKEWGADNKVKIEVYQLDGPVDLLVGLEQLNLLVEVKNPMTGGSLTPAQKAFIKTWPGQVAVIHTPSMAKLTLELVWRALLKNRRDASRAPRTKSPPAV